MHTFLYPQGERLYGRGTTDCLGYVAMVTELLLQLAEKKVPLKFSVTAVFIAWYVHAGKTAIW